MIINGKEYLKPKEEHRLTKSSINKRILSKNIQLIGSFKGVHTTSTFKCLVCGHTRNMATVNVLYENYKCKQCKLNKEKENVNNKLMSKSFKLTETFKGNTKKQNITCMKCNYIFHVAPRRILESDRKCPKCSTRAARTQKRFENKIKKLKIIMLSAYKNGKTKVKIKCTKCNTISQPTPTNLLRPGAGCRHCSIIIPLNIAKKRLSKKKIDILQYISFSEKALLRCEKCQYIWKASPDQIFHTSGCPVCNARKNEKLTLKYLKEMLKNITIEYQYSVKYDIKKRFIIDYAFKTKNNNNK